MGLSFNLMFMASAIYRIDIAQLEIYQLILIGSALEIAVFVFEVPTGLVADIKSRRLSVIIGLFIIGIGFIFEALTTYFYMIFIAQVIWGFGYTFISGALQSWVSDETQNKDIEHTIIKGAQFYKLFTVLGIILAGVIGMYNIRLAIYVSGSLFFLLGLFTVFMMKEEHFVKHDSEVPLHKQYVHQLGSAFKHVKTSKVLRVMFVIMLFFGLYSEGIDRTHERFILNDLEFRYLFDIAPIWIISGINIMVSLAGYILLGRVKKYVNKGHHVVLWAMNFTLMMVVGIVIFSLVPIAYVALFGYIFFSINREGSYPLLDTILLKSTPSHVKATVLSGFGQLDAIGQLLSGAIMVGISLIFGMKIMLLCTAGLLLVPALLFTLIKEGDLREEI